MPVAEQTDRRPDMERGRSPPPQSARKRPHSPPPTQRNHETVPLVAKVAEPTMPDVLSLEMEQERNGCDEEGVPTTEDACSALADSAAEQEKEFRRWYPLGGPPHCVGYPGWGVMSWNQRLFIARNPTLTEAEIPWLQEVKARAAEEKARRAESRKARLAVEAKQREAHAAPLVVGAVVTLTRELTVHPGRGGHQHKIIPAGTVGEITRIEESEVASPPGSHAGFRYLQFGTDVQNRLEPVRQRPECLALATPEQVAQWVATKAEEVAKEAKEKAKREAEKEEIQRKRQERKRQQLCAGVACAMVVVLAATLAALFWTTWGKWVAVVLAACAGLACCAATCYVALQYYACYRLRKDMESAPRVWGTRNWNGG
eukprot:COSAG02_NODE_5293_length_4465_cov_1579.441594_2_plen_372_part_00